MKILLSVLLCLGLMACGSGSDSGSGGALKGGLRTQVRVGTPEDSSLGGVWVQNKCELKKVDGKDYYQKGVIAFMKEGVQISNRTFLDSNCTNPITEETIITSNRARMVDLKKMQLSIYRKDVIAYVVTPETADVAKTLNQARQCGLSDWAVSEPRSVFATSCESELRLGIPETIEIKGTISDDLNSIVADSCPSDGACERDTLVRSKEITISAPPKPVLTERLVDGDITGDWRADEIAMSLKLSRDTFRMDYNDVSYLAETRNGEVVNQRTIEVARVSLSARGALSQIALGKYRMDVRSANAMVTITPFSAEGAANLNQRDGGKGRCGRKDWTVGVPVTLSIAECTEPGRAETEGSVVLSNLENGKLKVNFLESNGAEGTPIYFHRP